MEHKTKLLCRKAAQILQDRKDTDLVVHKALLPHNAKVKSVKVSMWNVACLPNKGSDNYSRALLSREQVTRKPNSRW